MATPILPTPPRLWDGKMMPRRRSVRFRFALAGVALALFVVLAGLAGWLLPEVRPAEAASTLTVYNVEITSNPGADLKYATGDTILVEIFADHCISGHSGGSLGITIGDNIRRVSPSGRAGSPTRSNPTAWHVQFSYTVVAADRDADGITVAPDALAGTWTMSDSVTDCTANTHTSASPTLPNDLLYPQAGHRVNAPHIDYDTDGDNLIEITTLAQLAAMEQDRDGNGDPSSGAGTTAYNAAFPDREAGAAGRMGCPGTCAGYELMADLDFDTTGDDVADPPYATWSPINTFETTFQGNGHTISNINISARHAAMFSTLGGSGVITAVGLINPTVVSTGSLGVGAALAGNNSGVISASYVRGGSVTGSAEDSGVGGLVGSNRATVRASYAFGTTVSSPGQRNVVGGLVGNNANSGAVIEYSYAASAVTATGSSTIGVGCLTVNDLGGTNGTIRSSYYSSTACTAGGGGTAQTATQLQAPTGYTGIYGSWNRNLDGVAGGDDPWEFGTASQYPVLKYLLTDYDDDDDNLIDVTTLAQLNAIRWDVNGDGEPAAANLADYNAAFPSRPFLAAGRMGCASTCAGYELRADLDFDTTGNDDVADAPYASWTPIAGYTGTFQGNGHTISNLTINNTSGSGTLRLGLFDNIGGSVSGVGLPGASISSSYSGTLLMGPLAGNVISGGSVTSSWATGSVTSTDAGSGAKYIGGLVGHSEHPVRASYSEASVTAANAATGVSAGGLAGGLNLFSATLTASYATGAVSGGTGSGSHVGGLVGQFRSNAPSIIASYATGAVTGGGAGANVGGLVGSAGSATITNSYWDTTSSGITGTGAGTGQTTTALQTPTAYGTGASIYANWNVNADGDTTTGAMTTGADDPWSFGTASQYPILQFNRDVIGIQWQRNPGASPMDYDDDDDNLIDVRTLAQLDAIRYDLDGDGLLAKGKDSAGYAPAFPGLSIGMGCPDTCTGYELRQNLDFDTAGDDDVADAPYANFTPIGADAGRYTGAFDGNNHTIANLTITSANSNVGLFVGVEGDISGIGLPGASVRGSHNTGRIGALAGQVISTGSVASSWATGSVASTSTTGDNKYIGGLVGYAFGPVRASYAGVDVSADSTATAVSAGGLAGYLSATTLTASYATGNVAGGTSSSSYVGGLVGSMHSGARITASYARGIPSSAGASANVGGLAGSSGGAVITNSYWDVTASGIADSDPTNSAGEGRKTYELRTPTAYGTTGIYSDWNVDVDGATGNDDPWAFGSNIQYPVLRYGGLDTARQFSAQPTIATDDTLSALTVAPVTLTPAFTAGTTAYTATLPAAPADSVTVAYTGDASAEVSISAEASPAAAVTTDADADAAGHQVVLFGPTMVITVSVSAPDGSATDYVITIAGIPENDYDGDDDNLIDVRTLAQLNAIRYDLNGDGAADSMANAAAYRAVFPYPAGGSRCAGTCAGYELRADLDFDTTGDDDVADAPYASWTPIGTYTSTFQGNGHTIANLSASASGSDARGGLFAVLGSGGTITAVGLVNPTVSSAGTTNRTGGLVGENNGTISAVLVSGGTVTSNSEDAYTGGLVGRNNGTIRAAYATASVSNSNRSYSDVGGLVGNNQNGAVIASYAAGSVNGGGNSTRLGCLVGRNSGGMLTGTITNGYWNSTLCTYTGGGGTGQTTSALQTPTGYTGIYSAWNINADGDTSTGAMTTGADDPWSFGTASQYPILQFDRDVIGIQQQRAAASPMDYDDDDDNLIDVRSLAQLDAIRYDLNGDGAVAKGSVSARYLAAFPGLSRGMGCRTTCTGYELRQSLDFDTTGDDDVADAPYDNWTPIGGDYAGNFVGNNHTIANLNVDAAAGVLTVGLFGGLTGAISGVGLDNATVTSAASTGAIGALVGTVQASGTVTSSWSTGSVTSTNAGTAAKYVGGLAGFVYGTVRASYSAAAVTASDSAILIGAGGLAGSLNGGNIIASYATGNVAGGTSASSYVGGLVGSMGGSAPGISASYAIGTPSSGGTNTNIGGLAGNLPSGAVIANSYWDTDASGIADTMPTASAGEGKTTNELRRPTAYGTTTSIYAAWNVDVDGDASTGDADGNDDPWDFGANDEYPVLKYGGMDTAMQVNLQPTVGALATLTVAGAALSSAFDTATLAYTATLPDGATATTVTVAATPTNPTATVSYSAVAGTADAVTADADADTADHQVILGGPNTVITITVTPHSGVAQSYTVTIAVPENDYDDDDDNLIDVTTLAQLDAIRYDLNGDGAADNAAGAVAYAAAYLYPSPGMGCAATCAGYELRADLDFDTDDSGSVTSVDDYPNWAPLGDATTAYSGTFKGNNYVIDNLTISAGATVADVGLFGVASGAISGVGLPNVSITSAGSVLLDVGALAGQVDATGSVTASWSTGSVAATDSGASSKTVGGLVGGSTGNVRASYSTASVTASQTAAFVYAGGLVGYLDNADIIASYATGNVAGGGGASSFIGGLTSFVNGGGTASNVIASYATGTLTGAANVNINGLFNWTAGALPTTTASYWDVTTTGLADDADTTGPEGKTTSELQAPTAYGTSGIYAGWNVNADGDTGTGAATTGADDPWSFGSNSQYPILQFGYDAVGITRQRGGASVDYDANDNNLIDVATLARLDAIRYDLNGDGVSATGKDAVQYAAAFPGLTPGMGCPATCTGYELTADLDFDTDDSGEVDSSDTYPNWTPIGTGAALFSGTFDGNNRTIANLTINAASTVSDVGLFGRVSGDISGVGLPDASVTGAANEVNAGVLAGYVFAGGSVTSSWATGSVTSTSTSSDLKRTGGLVGYAFGPVQASYARVDVTAANTATTVSAGGLVGSLNRVTLTASYATGAVSAAGANANSYAGGLVGLVVRSASVITASYATGAVTAGTGANTGGLAGLLFSGATAVNSYWDTETSGITGTGAGLGKTTAELQSPTAYGTTGIYSDWNVDVGGTSANDDPWDFGYAVQYPVLKYDGMDVLAQGRDTIVLVPAALDLEAGDTATYTVRLGAEPTAAVTVNIASNNAGVTIDDGDGTFAAGETLNFATTSWDDAQRITVRVASGASLGAATLAHSATGAGSGFDGSSADLPVGITIDYDVDDNNLIDVATLAQLNAIRYDLNGDGAVSATDATAYTTAFPGRAAGMGCRTTCAGYELTADLDFDTDDSGTVDSSDTYPNWTPIGTYTSTFDGGGHTISNLTISSSAGTQIGLFTELGSGGVISAVGMINPSVSGTVSEQNSGALAGKNDGGTISAVYSSGGSVSATGGDAITGGLVGWNRGTIRASYSTTAVNGSTNSGTTAGLAGINTFGSIIASYAAAAITGVSGSSTWVHCLSRSGSATNSYYDSALCTHSGGIGTGKTTAELQSPTAYGTTGIYSAWNVDVGGTSANDDPWDFGYASQYPVLKYDGLDLLKQGRDTIVLTPAALDLEAGETGTYTVRLGGEPAAAVTVAIASDSADVTFDGPDAATAFTGSETLNFSTTNWLTAQRITVRVASGASLGTATLAHTAAGAGSGFAGRSASLPVGITLDYDDNDNNLIDVATLAQLDAIRYDLNGDGAVSATDATAYTTAFPGRAAGMGCPDTCTGYELTADLDFDTDDSGTVDSSDTYPNWTPIGGTYTGDFDGNNHTIANLTINAAASVTNVGLFGVVSGDISGVGLPDVNVNGASNIIRAGALAGLSSGSITSSWATGSVASTSTTSDTKRIGGLVGFATTPVRASYAGVDVTAANTATVVYAGGLVGNLLSGTVTASYATGAVAGGAGSASYAGGLVGGAIFNTSVITASYATGAVTAGASGVTGGLAGQLSSGATAVNSYWDTETSGITGTGAGLGKTTAELQSPTAYGATGIYSAWNVDVGGTSANDDPWDFGYASQYPVLKYDGLDLLKQGRDTIVLAPDPLSVGEGATVTYTVRLGGAPKAGTTVTVTITSPSDDAITIDGPDSGSAFNDSETMTFTGGSGGNWNTERTVRVRAGSDANLADETTTLTHTAAGAGSGFAGVSNALSVTVEDDDRGRILLTQNSAAITALTINEGAAADTTYQVALSQAPVADVTVTVTTSDVDAVTIDGPDGDTTFSDSETMTFNSTNYATAQTVTIKAPADADPDNESVTLSHAATDATMGTNSGYDGVSESLSVTVTDDDAPNIVLSVATLTVDEENDSPATYTVALATQPTADVTVTVTAAGDLEIDDNSGTDFGASETLTFTGGATGNWNTAQSIRVNATADNDLKDDTPTITHNPSSTDSGYNALANKNLNVTITDNDTGSIVLKQSGSALTTLALSEGGATVNYTVELSHQPTADVSVTVTAAGDVTIDNASGSDFDTSETLTFTPSSYGAQTIRARAANDSDLGNDTTMITHVAADATTGVTSDYASVNNTLDVTVTDTTTPSFLLTQNSVDITALTVNEQGSDVTYQVALSHVPTGAVTVTVTATGVSIDGPDGAVGDTSFSTSETLTFDASNWQTAQTVTIQAPVNDADSMDGTATLAHSAAGGGYADVSKSLSVTIDDDDDPDILLWHGTNDAAITTLPVTEEGDATYRVRLNTLPTADVSVLISAGDGLEVDNGSDTYGSSRTLSFSTTNWNALQTVTIRATADDDLAADSASLSHAASNAGSTASAYAGVSKSLSVPIIDNDTPTIILSETALSVDEGGTGTYTVKLSNQPAAGVTITITSSATDDVTIATDGTFSDSETLSFSTTNWNTPQTVTVKGATDNDLSHDTGNTLTHAASNTVSSMDSLFTGAATVSLSVTVTDTTAPSILLTQSGADITTLAANEEGANVNYQVGLSHAPLANVTVTVTSGNAAVQIHDGGSTFTDADFGSSRTLTFTAMNYGTAQTVTIKAPNDPNPVNESVTLTHAASGSLSGYESVSDATLTVNVMDNDTPNILLSESMLTVAEAGTNTYTVKLATEPTAGVTVTITASGGVTISGDGGTTYGSSRTLSFTTGNYGMTQTITVRAADDNDLANGRATLSHRAGGGDYAGKTASLPVTITNNDTGSIVLSSTDALSVTEGASAGASYTVALSHRPAATATVTISSANSEVAVSPSTLTFTRAAWSASQTATVTATAVADADLTDGSDTLTHTAADAGSTPSGYASAAAPTRSVMVLDTTAPGITLSEAALSVVEGDNATYSVKLAAQPAAEVTVAIASRDPEVTVNPAPLTFSTTNYGSNQSVTVNTTADDDAFHNASWLTHTPTIRGIAGDVTLLPALLREPAPSESEEPARIRIRPPPPSTAATSTIYAIAPHTTLTVSGTAGVPDGVTVNTVQSLAGDLTITFSVPSGIPATLDGYTLDGATLVGISVMPAAPAGGLEICLPRGDGSTQLLHYRSGRWQVVPGSGPRGDQVCGTVSEFSPFIAGQPAAVAPETEPERPPIIYNLNIRFDARRIALPEGHTASYQVRLAGRPAGRGATIRIRSDNPDVKPTPAELRFTAANWEQWQTVSIAIAGDANHTDESATLAHYGPNRGYGSVLVSVTDTGDSRQAGDTLAPALTVVTEPGARWGVTVTATMPADLTAHGVVRVSPAYGVPRTAAGYGLGRNGAAQAIVRIAAPADAPASGLTVCLPVARALADEAGERALTLLRYVDADTGGGWQAVPGAEYDAVGRSVCAAGVSEFGAFAAAYVLP